MISVLEMILREVYYDFKEVHLKRTKGLQTFWEVKGKATGRLEVKQESFVQLESTA